jgi:hypothetical protein
MSNCLAASRKHGINREAVLLPSECHTVKWNVGFENKAQHTAPLRVSCHLLYSCLSATLLLVELMPSEVSAFFSALLSVTTRTRHVSRITASKAHVCASRAQQKGNPVTRLCKNH